MKTYKHIVFDIDGTLLDTEKAIHFERAGIDARDALYIGDTVYDSQCARSAGVNFGLALWGNAGTQGIPADYRFQTPREVLRGLDMPSVEYKTAVHDSGNSDC